jgi:TATA-binding protein-associated factor Taf7
MNERTIQAENSENEFNAAQQQKVSDDSQHEQETIEQEYEEESGSEKERSSEILKKYLECLKSPLGKKRRRCISQELG